MKLLFDFGALGNSLSRAHFPAARGLQQVAQLANWPVVHGIRGRLRVPVGQHVLAHQTAIVLTKDRQPCFTGVTGAAFLVRNRGIIDRLQLGVCASVRPVTRGSITGHDRCFERIVR
jgi:hypothetical protein